MIDVERIARVCHEVNRAFCLASGDDSLVPWDEAPDWQRKSCIDGVRFALANPDATPGRQHEAWLAAKRADGWRYGTIKNAVIKEHPCFMPYENLPARERTKDQLFLAVVRAMAAGERPAA